MNIIIAFGKIAGIAGLSIGTFVFLISKILDLDIFEKMNSENTYKTIRLIIIASLTIGILGMTTWILSSIIGK